MTEWHGIKVGGLYKQTGRGSRGAPLLMVVGFELPLLASRRGTTNGIESAVLNFLEESVLKKDFLTYEERNGITDFYDKKWPYKLVA